MHPHPHPLNALLLGLVIAAPMTLAGATWLLPSADRAGALHLGLAIGVMPLILTAMLYFTPVLTRSGAAPRRMLLVPVAALLAGAWGGYAVSHDLTRVALPLFLALLSVTALAYWILRRMESALGTPHPGARWYLTALLFLWAGLLAMLAATHWTGHWMAFKQFHLHTNLMGFVGLTAFSTLQVLLPTAASISDPGAARRLRFDFWLAAVGTGGIGFGAALWDPFSLAGGGLWLWAWVRWQTALWPFRRLLLTEHREGTALYLAGWGFGVLLLSGLLHALDLIQPTTTAAWLIGGFLLPLVTGAAGHLLPLWRWPLQPDIRKQGQRLLARYGLLRTGLFWAGGLTLPWHALSGALFVSAGLMMFLLQVWYIWIQPKPEPDPTS